MSPVYLLASPPGQPFRQSEATFPSPHIPAPPPPCARVCLAHTLPIWNVTLYVTLCFTLFIDPFVFQCPAERRSMTSGGSRAARSRPVIGAAVASDRLWAHHAAPALGPTRRTCTRVTLSVPHLLLRSAFFSCAGTKWATAMLPFGDMPTSRSLSSFTL